MRPPARLTGRPNHAHAARGGRSARSFLREFRSPRGGHRPRIRPCSWRYPQAAIKTVAIPARNRQTVTLLQRHSRRAWKIVGRRPDSQAASRSSPGRNRPRHGAWSRRGGRRAYDRRPRPEPKHGCGQRAYLPVSRRCRSRPIAVRHERALRPALADPAG